MSEVNFTDRMQRMVSRLPMTETPRFTATRNPDVDRQQFPLSLTPYTLLLALHRARQARELAISYRDFKVGAALAGLTYAPSRMKIMTGTNIKPDPESSINVHAEQAALQKARDYGFDAVSMVVVVGETQADQQSGNEMPTLHPCGLCRGILANDALIDPKATVIASALPDFSTVELYDLQTLHRFHETNDASGMEKFEFPALSLFEPAPTDTNAIVVEDTPQLRAEERIWDSTIGAYLAEKKFELLSSARQ